MTRPEPLLVITNADAGTADQEYVEAALAVLRDHAEVEVCATASPEELDGRLADIGDQRIVVAGGDGSVHAVVGALYRADLLEGRTLALIPLGTGNDFARTLDIPLEPEAAAEVVVHGRPRPVDLIVDDDDAITVNSVHVGAGAEAGERGARWKERLGSIGVGRLNLGKLGYPIGALETAFDPPVLRVRVEVDGELVVDTDRHVLMVAVGNGASVGGGTELMPDADPHDGLIDILIARPARTRDRIGVALRLPFGRHEDHRTVQSLQGRSVEVSGTPFLCNSDGEIDGPVGRRSWRVVPGAYRMVVPAER